MKSLCFIIKVRPHWNCRVLGDTIFVCELDDVLAFLARIPTWVLKVMQALSIATSSICLHSFSLLLKRQGYAKDHSICIIYLRNKTFRNRKQNIRCWYKWEWEFARFWFTMDPNIMERLKCVHRVNWRFSGSVFICFKMSKPLSQSGFLLVSHFDDGLFYSFSYVLDNS